jgi:exosortase A-associated hydrolase 2
MAALQARRLAELGVDVLLLDPFGTGDSAGEFSDASWVIWREDIKAAMNWLSARTDGQVGLWGLRLGALLAADVIAEDPGCVTRLVLWQPVLSGDRYLTQFLRLRLAASLDKTSNRETTKDLRARLSAGEALEVAGYKLMPTLAREIGSRNLAAFLQHTAGPPLLWLEVAAEANAPLTTASQEVIDTVGQLRPVQAKSVLGEPFWMIQETTIAPNLLEATEDGLRA